MRTTTTHAERQADIEAARLTRRIENGKRELEHERQKIASTKAEGNQIIFDANEVANRIKADAVAEAKVLRDEAASDRKAAAAQMIEADAYAERARLQAEYIQRQCLRDAFKVAQAKFELSIKEYES